MRFILSDIQQQYVDTVREFATNDIKPFLRDQDGCCVVPRQIFTKAWELGLTSFCIPKTYKSFDVDFVSSVLGIKELSYCDESIAASIMSNYLANAVISMHGSVEQQQSFLNPFGEKPALASFCLTEPNMAVDYGAMETFVKKREDGRYLLNGVKCYVTNALYAERLTVVCNMDNPKSGMLICVVVPCRPEGHENLSDHFHGGQEIKLASGGKIIVYKPEKTFRRTMMNTFTVIFEDVVVEEDQILGERSGKGFQCITDVLDYAVPMVAAINAGLAKKAFDLSIEYMNVCNQFGKQTIDKSVVNNILLPMWEKCELAEWSLFKAAIKVQEKAIDWKQYASIAKIIATEAALYCITKSIHHCGDYGCIPDREMMKLHRMFIAPIFY